MGAHHTKSRVQGNSPQKRTKGGNTNKTVYSQAPCDTQETENIFYMGGGQEGTDSHGLSFDPAPIEEVQSPPNDSDSIRVPPLSDSSSSSKHDIGGKNVVTRKKSKKNFQWHVNEDEHSIKGKQEETVVKKAGWVSGDALTIEDCSNTDIYVFDYMDSVQMDGCKECRVFLGAVAGSVFIRDCVDCSFVLACQQMRVRDSSNLKMSLLCTTQPIIEQTSGSKFKCLQASYDGMADHLEKAKLQVFNNTWKDIFDFSDSTGKNYGVLVGQSEAELVPVPTENPYGLKYDRVSSVIPMSASENASGQRTFLVLSGEALVETSTFVGRLQKMEPGQLALLRSMDILLETGRFTKHLQLSPDETTRLGEGLCEGETKQRIIAMELSGTTGLSQALVSSLSPLAQRHAICMTIGGAQRAAGFFALVNES